MTSNSRLFQPLQIGNATLSNRLVMAPLTRYRSTKEHVPHDYVAEYYTQRACVPGTLLITEATFISPRASGFSNVPGIWSEAQIAGWKKVVDSVHAAGGIIYLQLWALGRAAQPDVLKAETGHDLVSASDIPMSESAPKPRPMTEEEIQIFIKDYAQAAKNAVQGAGFDGVEIHGANGYLIDQFIQDVSNKRTDKYGGSIENRGRFAIEVAKAVVDAVGPEHTAIRLSPFSVFQGMKMQDPVPQFSYVIEQLKKLKLSYLHVVESRVAGSADAEPSQKIDFAIDIWGDTSPVLVAGGFKPDSAKIAADETYKNSNVAIVFGRYFISTPDLVYRLKNGIELTPYDRSTFYIKESTKGYIDYPFSSEFQKEAKL